MTRGVVVVGDVVVDVLARSSGPPLAGTDTEAAIRTAGGGAGANTAAWLAHLGVPVTLVARVGDDAAGREQAAELAALGVRCAFAVDPDAPTGTIVVLVGPDGERAMLADRGANLRLSPADLPALAGGHAGVPRWVSGNEGRPRGGGHLHLSGYTVLHDGPRPAGLAALRAAREAGLTVSVDPASTAPLAATGPDRFLDWTCGADLLLPNLAEARLLAGCDEATGAARALASAYGAVAVTLGADGALWARGGEVVHVPAPRGVPVVDSTGAGDAFTAGFLAAWLGGASGPDATLAGTGLAATVVGRLGARP